MLNTWMRQPVSLIPWQHASNPATAITPRGRFESTPLRAKSIRRWPTAKPGPQPLPRHTPPGQAERGIAPVAARRPLLAEPLECGGRLLYAAHVGQGPRPLV